MKPIDIANQQAHCASYWLELISHRELLKYEGNDIEDLKRVKEHLTTALNHVNLIITKAVENE